LGPDQHLRCGIAGRDERDNRSIAYELLH
jgi:hypothetical protein